jgi:hypothetical protein
MVSSQVTGATDDSCNPVPPATFERRRSPLAPEAAVQEGEANTFIIAS